MPYTKNLDSFPAPYHMLLGKMQQGTSLIELTDLPLGLALDTRRKFYGFRTALLLDAERKAKAKHEEEAANRRRDYDLAMRFAVEVSCEAKPRTAWTKLLPQDIVTLRFILKDAQDGNKLLMEKLAAVEIPPSLDELFDPSPVAALDDVIASLYGSEPLAKG